MLFGRCDYCKALAPKWAELGEKFASKADVIIARVDCTVSMSLCSDHEVSACLRSRFTGSGLFGVVWFLVYCSFLVLNHPQKLLMA
jgi:hypothetical protein